MAAESGHLFGEERKERDPKMRLCPQCGGTEIDEDSGRGDAICMDCGTVVEESIVVADNQFQERAGGAGSSLVGQTISMDRQHASVQGVPGLTSQESREVTHAKGRKLIEEVASQLRINKHCIETAFNFFKMCVARNLTKGRARSNVVASCLYMTCRLENTSHLLLDFSDVTAVNVFDLGRTLNFIVRSLHIQLPCTDPCMYVLRFAIMLDFGDKQKEVITLATRLVQRMKKDWLSTGRRPTGLCGAALLLAARSHNFNRSVADVVRVVHVSEAVVRKRLDEFALTPSSALTLDQFTTVELEHCEDPPAFRDARRKATLQREEEEAEKIENQMAPITAEVEDALEKKQREKFKRSPYARMIGGTTGVLDEVRENSLDRMGAAESSLINTEILDSVYSSAFGTDVEEEENPYAAHQRTYAPSLETLGIRPGSSSLFNPIVQYGGIAPAPTMPLPPSDHPNGDLLHDDINDDEIESYILTDKESLVKEKVWMKVNGEHLALMELKRKERAEGMDKESEDKKGKKRKVSRRREPIHAATPAEAIEKIIQEKKLSSKINYDALNFGGEAQEQSALLVSKAEEEHQFKVPLLTARIPKLEVPKLEKKPIGINEDPSTFFAPLPSTPVAALPSPSASSLPKLPKSPRIVKAERAATPGPTEGATPKSTPRRKRPMARPNLPPSKELQALSKAFDAPSPSGTSPGSEEAKKPRIELSNPKNADVEMGGENEASTSNSVIAPVVEAEKPASSSSISQGEKKEGGKLSRGAKPIRPVIRKETTSKSAVPPAPETTAQPLAEGAGEESQPETATAPEPSREEEGEKKSPLKKGAAKPIDQKPSSPHKKVIVDRAVEEATASQAADTVSKDTEPAASSSDAPAPSGKLVRGKRAGPLIGGKKPMIPVPKATPPVDSPSPSSSTTALPPPPSASPRMASTSRAASGADAPSTSASVASPIPQGEGTVEDVPPSTAGPSSPDRGVSPASSTTSGKTSTKKPPRVKANIPEDLLRRSSRSSK